MTVNPPRWPRFVWRGNVAMLIEYSPGWTYRFYGLTFGQSGLGILRRVRK